jgi:hypothetical protein
MLHRPTIKLRCPCKKCTRTPQDRCHHAKKRPPSELEKWSRIALQIGFQVSILASKKDGSKGSCIHRLMDATTRLVAERSLI